MVGKDFKKEYDRLNKEQKEAVDSIDGPVMVIAGPGTGKTQILALRIANILNKGVITADGILCLTFTNAGVTAMRERLFGYIDGEANKIKIATFHSFAIELIEKYSHLLSFPRAPELLTDDRAVFLVDEILQMGNWQYLRPRTNPAMYFNDLKQLISILKRERISASEFLEEVENDIENFKNNPENISSRGERKGELKKEVEKKIESIERTREVVEFYRLYENKKKELFLMDYDDVLEYATKLVEDYEEVRADIREEYLYVLVDEHQDSSGVQNSFLKFIWQETEQPNIFVVGDDRQLIYGFSGASLSYFEEFAHIFGKAKLITLTENYRSTESILALADDLLQSSLTNKKLKSNSKNKYKIYLNEYSYPRDEIIGAGIFFQEKIKDGIDPNECALLLPRNYQVREAINILNNMGLPVASGKNLSFFRVPETMSLRRVLSIIADPFNNILLADSLLDKTSEIPTIEAHKFLKENKASQLTIEELVKLNNSDLFSTENKILRWGNQLKKWIENLSGEKISQVVNIIGNELLIDTAKNNDELLKNIEVVRSFIHSALLFEERHKNASLKEFLEYIDRLDLYNIHIELVKFGSDNGIKVMTLHRSKGLEYHCVAIAHMNEEVLMSEKKGGFTLPEKIKVHMEKRNMEVVKKELYVAITRTKEFCQISYARQNYNGSEMELAEILRELPEIHFIKKDQKKNEDEILSLGPRAYTEVQKRSTNENELEEIKKLVQENYTFRKVSVTLLNNFFECPWKWYFRNFLQLPTLKGASLAFGSAVHATIEYILNSEKLLNEKSINEKIRSELISEGVNDKKDLLRLTNEAIKAVQNWIQEYQADLAKKYQSEKSVSYRDKNFPHLNIYGKIDLIEYLPDGKMRVSDFKTGSVKTKSIIEKIEESRMSSFMRQLAMYSYLINGAEKENKISKSRFIFLEANSKDKNALYETQINQEHLDMLVKDIQDYDNFLQKGIWVDLPCNFKSYGKGEKCEYCTRAEKFKNKNI